MIRRRIYRQLGEGGSSFDDFVNDKEKVGQQDKLDTQESERDAERNDAENNVAKEAQHQGQTVKSNAEAMISHKYSTKELIKDTALEKMFDNEAMWDSLDTNISKRFDSELEGINLSSEQKLSIETGCKVYILDVISKQEKSEILRLCTNINRMSAGGFLAPLMNSINDSLKSFGIDPSTSQESAKKTIDTKKNNSTQSIEKKSDGLTALMKPIGDLIGYLKKNKDLLNKPRQEGHPATHIQQCFALTTPGGVLGLLQHSSTYPEKDVTAENVADPFSKVGEINPDIQETVKQAGNEFGKKQFTPEECTILKNGLANLSEKTKDQQKELLEKTRGIVGQINDLTSIPFGAVAGFLLGAKEGQNLYDVLSDPKSGRGQTLNFFAKLFGISKGIDGVFGDYYTNQRNKKEEEGGYSEASKTSINTAIAYAQTYGSTGKNIFEELELGKQDKVPYTLAGLEQSIYATGDIGIASISPAAIDAMIKDDSIIATIDKAKLKECLNTDNTLNIAKVKEHRGLISKLFPRYFSSTFKADVRITSSGPDFIKAMMEHLWSPRSSKQRDQYLQTTHGEPLNIKADPKLEKINPPSIQVGDKKAEIKAEEKKKEEEKKADKKKKKDDKKNNRDEEADDRSEDSELDDEKSRNNKNQEGQADDKSSEKIPNPNPSPDPIANNQKTSDNINNNQENIDIQNTEWKINEETIQRARTSGFRGPTNEALLRDNKFINKLAEIAKSLSIDPNLILRVMYSESGMNPHALNTSGGDFGLIQFHQTSGLRERIVANPDPVAQLDVVKDFYTGLNNIVGKGNVKNIETLYLYNALPSRVTTDSKENIQRAWSQRNISKEALSAGRKYKRLIPQDQSKDNSNV